AERSIELLGGSSETQPGLAMCQERLRARPCIERLHDDPPVMDVVVDQPEEGQHRRSDVRVIRPDRIDLAHPADAGAHVAHPGRRYLVLDIAVVPREALIRSRWNRGT